MTDASVVLGYLNPARFAGGTLTLDVRGGRARGGRRRPAGSGLDTVAAAAGIHRVVNARMADQIRLVTIKRGYDPRQFALVVLGGAGPVHGAALAEEMGMAEVLVPEAPGVLAAFGLLAAAIEHHHARTLQARTDEADLDAVNRCLAELDAAGRGADARGRRGGRAGARGLRGRHALRRPGVRAGGSDRGAGHARAAARRSWPRSTRCTSASTAMRARSSRWSS